ncbi:MAG: ABC transporter ATP-binding protein [Spirochaetales bacterium]
MDVKIKAQNISKVYSNGKGIITALKDFSLEVREGEFLCIVGPSGCGKSSFLRILAGLMRPSSGSLTILPPKEANKPVTNMVFQEYAVFPWKTVLENVAFGLQMRGFPSAERKTIAQYWIDRVGLSKFVHSYPHQLSGGMKQRVGIARALANDPEILLMDEPLGALDAQTRLILQEEILRIWEERRKTVVYVTHSIEEAVLLGDRVVLMTAHPGTHKATYPIPLPRPRDLHVTATKEYGELTFTIWESLRGEVVAALESEGQEVGHA